MSFQNLKVNNTKPFPLSFHAGVKTGIYFPWVNIVLFTNEPWGPKKYYKFIFLFSPSSSSIHILTDRTDFTITIFFREMQKLVPWILIQFSWYSWHGQGGKALSYKTSSTWIKGSCLAADYFSVAKPFCRCMMTKIITDKVEQY